MEKGNYANHIKGKDISSISSGKENTPFSIPNGKTTSEGFIDPIISPFEFSSKDPSYINANPDIT
jgi:hypothetical protein